MMSAILALQANSCDQNLNHCLELIEQGCQSAGTTLGILTVAAQEGENVRASPSSSPLFAFFSFSFPLLSAWVGCVWLSPRHLVCGFFQEDIMMVWNNQITPFALAGGLLQLLPWGNLWTARSLLYR